MTITSSNGQRLIQREAARRGTPPLPTGRQAAGYPSGERVRSWPLTLPASLLATVATILWVAHGIHAPLPSQAMVSQGISVASPQPLITAGTAYYVRLHIEDLRAAQRAMRRVFSEAAVLRIKGPYAGRYYVAATPAQVQALLRTLSRVGDPGVIATGTGRWLDDPLPPGACSLVLDLLQ